jgi:hypothetical protein
VANNWIIENILVVVRAYPQPSKNYIELSCVAGITDGGSVRRLHPIPDRYLPQNERFRKYDILELSTQKSDDPRPESYRVDLDRSTFAKVGRIETEGTWLERDNWIEPFRAQSMEELAVGDVYTSRSLALIRPSEITRFEIIPTGLDDWPSNKQRKLSQSPLLGNQAVAQLEYIPWSFKYQFRCNDTRCRGHSMTVLDWEIAQSYRTWRMSYGSDWQSALRKKYQDDLMSKDLQFFVGTMLKYPRTWTIVGLYYPPHRSSEMRDDESPMIQKHFC